MRWFRPTLSPAAPQAFYHHLLVPRTHYLPVWRHGRGPEDILEALDWAQAHDEEARRIAQAGQVGMCAGLGGRVWRVELDRWRGAGVGVFKYKAK